MNNKLKTHPLRKQKSKDSVVAVEKLLHPSQTTGEAELGFPLQCPSGVSAAQYGNMRNFPEDMSFLTSVQGAGVPPAMDTTLDTTPNWQGGMADFDMETLGGLDLPQHAPGKLMVAERFVPIITPVVRLDGEIPEAADAYSFDEEPYPEAEDAYSSDEESADIIALKQQLEELKRQLRESKRAEEMERQMLLEMLDNESESDDVYLSVIEKLQPTSANASLFTDFAAGTTRQEKKYTVTVSQI